MGGEEKEVQGADMHSTGHRNRNIIIGIVAVVAAVLAISILGGELISEVGLRGCRDFMVGGMGGE